MTIQAAHRSKAAPGSAKIALKGLPKRGEPRRRRTPNQHGTHSVMNTKIPLGPASVVDHPREDDGADDILADAATLARDFDRLAIPEASRYANSPAHAEVGAAYREP
jgi:hypothetical protein